jgi:hypothetical protein
MTTKHTKLTELKKKNYARATGATCGVEITAKTPEAEEEAARLMSAIDRYFNDFAVVPDGLCPSCHNRLGGLLGSFSWGICHGEGHCSCGYPCRAYHRIKDDDGEEIFDGPFQRILPYHPDDLSVRSPTHDR